VKTKNLLSGFSLIEVLVAIAIMGIMASVGIPMFQDYLNRAKVSEGLSLIAPVKLEITEYAMEHESLSGVESSKAVDVLSQLKGAYVQKVSIGPMGVIRVLYLHPSGSLEFTPIYQKGQIQWTCQGGTLPNSWRPSACRN